MVWVPNPQEPSGMFEAPVVANCKTIIERDFKEALDYYYLDSPTYLTRYGQTNDVGPTGEDLKDFQEVVLGPPLKNVFPCVGIEPRRNSPNASEDNSHIIEVARVVLDMCVTADGADAVTEKIMKYVRIAHIVLQTARQDFFIGMSNPFGVVLDFDHLYDIARGDQTIVFRRAAVEISVGIRER